MPTRRSCGVNGSLIAAVVAAATLHVSAAQAPPDLDATLARIGNRIEEFYKRVQSLMCVEKVTAQAIRTDLSFEGFARVLEYDLRVEAATAGDGESSDANFV